MMNDETESVSTSEDDFIIPSGPNNKLALDARPKPAIRRDKDLNVESNHGLSGRSATKTNSFVTSKKNGGSESRFSSNTNHTSITAGSERGEGNGLRIGWSDGEASDDVYQNFKRRKSLKRKRDAALNRRAKGLPAKSRKHTRRPSEEAVKRTEEMEDDSEDEFQDLPDYLRLRRERFQSRKQELEQAGLRLPPDYDQITFSDDEDLESLQEKPDFSKLKPVAEYKDIQLPYSLGLIPAPIAQWLREYQVTGVAFLHKLFVYQIGGILGDDMGLGKTVQVIGFLTAAFGKTGDARDEKRMRKKRRADTGWYPRVLIVCPGTLIHNWQAELQRWGWWHVDVYLGSDKESALQTAAAGRIEILITTYATYRGSRDMINCVEWDCVIADECHIIKGRDSETTKAMNEVNALCRIGLTGTAIQNNYEELWTLLNWANPGKLGSVASWKTHISEPLKSGQSRLCTNSQLGRGRKIAQALVHNLLPQFFIRRRKSLIADQLPRKSDRVVFCPLTETQAEAYENFVDSEVVHGIKTSGDMCECKSGKKSGWCCNTLLPNGDKWQSHIFPAVAALQKIANHLALLIPDGNEPADKQERFLAQLEDALPTRWRELYRDRGSILNYSKNEFCGKWKVLKKLLAYWYNTGDKVLVFSHSKRLLKMYRLLFQKTSYNVSYLDGEMPYDERAKEVNDFNADPDQFVFLLSTKAGGVGLNITAANKVVILDPNWNPSWDLQAQDRAYRIGQSRDVEVFRLVSAGTIEEIVYARQIYKQQQANIGYTASTERRYFSGIQNNVAQKGEIFGLLNLFAYAGDNVVMRDIVHRTNVAEARAGVAITELDLPGSEESFDPKSSANNSLEDGSSNDLLLAGDSEDSAISQLVDMIAAEDPTLVAQSSKTKKSAPKKRYDPIQAILAEAGVLYFHENSEVVGSSRVEAHLSRKALEAGDDIDLDDKKLFQPQYAGANHHPGLEEETSAPEWKYKPPIDVMRRQFCSMANEFGFKDVTEFALVVEGWTQAQRRACLEKFYRIRRDALGIGKKED